MKTVTVSRKSAENEKRTPDKSQCLTLDELISFSEKMLEQSLEQRNTFPFFFFLISPSVLKREKDLKKFDEDITNLKEKITELDSKRSSLWIRRKQLLEELLDVDLQIHSVFQYDFY